MSLGLFYCSLGDAAAAALRVANPALESWRADRFGLFIHWGPVSGLKYLVFTSRHHDGFSMFDTKANDYNITSPLSPFGRDVVKELAEACHAAGLKFGLYYSQPNWQHLDAFAPARHAEGPTVAEIEFLEK